jgi:hypothetical protein
MHQPKRRTPGETRGEDADEACMQQVRVQNLHVERSY